MRYLFPALLCVLSAGASVVSFASGDWRRGVYFLCGVIITAVVTW